MSLIHRSGQHGGWMEETVKAFRRASHGRLRWVVVAALTLLASAAAQYRDQPNRVTTTPGRTAAVLTCGQTIMTDTILAADLSCPPEAEQGIIIGASNITLDLGGHVLSGYAPVGKVSQGIVASNVSGVTIRNGTVAEFSEGVDVFNSRGVTVENLSVRSIRSTDPDHFFLGSPSTKAARLW